MTRFKRGQGSCSFKRCDEEGISPGSPYIQMTPAEMSISIQLLKIQEPCPPFQIVSLGYSGEQEGQVQMVTLYFLESVSFKATQERKYILLFFMFCKGNVCSFKKTKQLRFL